MSSQVLPPRILLSFPNIISLSDVVVGEDHIANSLAQSGTQGPLNRDLVKNGPLGFSVVVFHKYLSILVSVPA